MCRHFDSHRLQYEYVHVCVHGWTNDLFFSSAAAAAHAAFNFRLSNWNLLLSFTVPHSRRVYVQLFQCAQSEIARTSSIFHFWHIFNFSWPHRIGFELNVEYARRKWTAATDLNLSSDDTLEIKCCYFHTFFFVRKYLIENIRVSLFCPDQSQLLYTQSCYEFRMENNRLTPSHIDDTSGESIPIDHISFEDDWICRKVYIVKGFESKPPILIQFNSILECCTVSRYGCDNRAEDQLDSFQWDKWFSFGCHGFV